MKIIFNCDYVVPLLRQVSSYEHIFSIHLEKNFFTPYGLFVPLFQSGILLNRALRGEIKGAELVKTEVDSKVVHVNHHGHVWYLSMSSILDDISYEQITGTDWSVSGFRNDPKANSLAYGHLLKGCKDPHKAVARMDRMAYDGFYQPDIFKVSDIAERLKKLGHTKDFFYTRFSDF